MHLNLFWNLFASFLIISRKTLKSYFSIIAGLTVLLKIQIFKHTILQLKYYSAKCVLCWHPRPFPANLSVTATSCNLSLGGIISLIAHKISLCIYCHISTIRYEHVFNAMMGPSELTKRLHFVYLGHPVLLYSIIKINIYYTKQILLMQQYIGYIF